MFRHGRKQEFRRFLVDVEPEYFKVPLRCQQEALPIKFRPLPEPYKPPLSKAHKADFSVFQILFWRIFQELQLEGFHQFQVLFFIVVLDDFRGGRLGLLVCGAGLRGHARGGVGSRRFTELLEQQLFLPLLRI